jgi:hypothetical protein
LGISQRQEVDYGSKMIKKLGFNIAEFVYNMRRKINKQKI